MDSEKSNRPLGLLAELTYRCPLHCPYCSNPLNLSSYSDELTLDEWVRVFSEARTLGVLQLHLSGGGAEGAGRDPASVSAPGVLPHPARPGVSDARPSLLPQGLARVGEQRGAVRGPLALPRGSAAGR